MIKIYVEEISGSKVSDYMLASIRKVIREAVNEAHPDLKLECSLSFCDDEYIRNLNREYRGLDSSTDVLSFPFFDFSTPDVVCQLGDIVISTDHAIAQAREYGHSLRRELCFLALHGCLHLLGYDHIEEDDRIKMEAKQDEILERTGITR